MDQSANEQRRCDAPPAPLVDRPSRMKTWEECGIEEKVERLRHVVLDLRCSFASTRETCEQLSYHGHDALGHVVVPLDRCRGGVVTGFDLLA